MNISYVRTISNPKRVEEVITFLSAAAFARELSSPPMFHPTHTLFFRQLPLCCHGGKQSDWAQSVPGIF